MKMNKLDQQSKGFGIETKSHLVKVCRIVVPLWTWNFDLYLFEFL